MMAIGNSGPGSISWSDPTIVLNYPLQVLATFLIIVVGKSLAAFVIVRAFGHPTGTAFTISASLAQIGEFSFILAGLGLQLKILPQEAHDMVLAGALLSIVANPFLFVALDKWKGRNEKEAPAPEISAALGLLAVAVEEAPASGAPVVGAALSAGLQAARIRVTERASRAVRAGFRFMVMAPYNQGADDIASGYAMK